MAVINPASKAMTGVTLVDAVLDGGYHWVGGLTRDGRTIITTNFVGDFGASEPVASLFWEDSALFRAFFAMEKYAKLDFVHTPSTLTADIRVITGDPTHFPSLKSDSPMYDDYQGEADTPYLVHERGTDQANVIINNKGRGWDQASVEIGGNGFWTAIHEIGHALGLKHGFDKASFGPSKVLEVSDPAEDGLLTMMSYHMGDITNGWYDNTKDVETYTVPGSGALLTEYGYLNGPGALDIAALQHLYGANETQGTGDDVYILPTSNAPGTYWTTIWDVGGTDEIRHDGASSVHISLTPVDLAAGSTSLVVSELASQVKGIKGGFIISDDFTNAIANVGDVTGVVIENATGGSGDDQILGNAADNRLAGGGGIDFLDGGAGNDLLDGGAHDDVLDGGDGVDTALYEMEDYSSKNIKYDEKAGKFLVTYQGATDTLVDVEFAQFKDVKVPLKKDCAEIDDLKKMLAGRGGDLKQSVSELNRLERQIELAEKQLEIKNLVYNADSALQLLAVTKWAADVAGSVLVVAAAVSAVPISAAAAATLLALDAVDVLATRLTTKQWDGAAAAKLAVDVVYKALGKKYEAVQELVEQISTVEKAIDLTYGVSRGLYDFVDPNGDLGKAFSDAAKTRTELLSLSKKIGELKSAEKDLKSGIKGIEDLVEGFDCNLTPHKNFIDDLLLIIPGSGFEPTLDGPSIRTIPTRLLFQGSKSDDIERGLATNDIMSGGAGNDTFLGKNGHDSISGNNGRDTLMGGKGGDFLSGNNGADKLYGQKGKDVLLAGNGNDLLSGGAGNDRFVFDVENSTGRNLIVDFSNGDEIVIDGARWKDVALTDTRAGNTRIDFGTNLTIIIEDPQSELVKSDFIFV